MREKDVNENIIKDNAVFVRWAEFFNSLLNVNYYKEKRCVWLRVKRSNEEMQYFIILAIQVREYCRFESTESVDSRPRPLQSVSDVAFIAIILDTSFLYSHSVYFLPLASFPID